MPKTKRLTKTAVRSRRHQPRGTNNRAFKKVYWPYIPLISVILFLGSFGSQNGLLQAAARHPNHTVLAYATGMSVSGLLADTNVARSDNGVAALSINGKLDAAAQAKANDMANRNYWSHNTPEGNPPWIFVTAQGYSYQKLGENLASGFNDEQTTINGWMASPGHRENMLNPDFTEVGFGYANNADYTSAGGGPMTIVVAFYGMPPPVPVQSSTPAAPVQSPPPASTPQVKNTPVANTAAPAKEETPAKIPAKASPKAVTTQTPPSSSTKSLTTSRAKVAFARLPASGLIASTVGLGAFLAAAVWIGRHMSRVRRTWKHGEKYVLTHPLFDLGLLLIAILSFLLSKTAGFVI